MISHECPRTIHFQRLQAHSRAKLRVLFAHDRYSPDIGGHVWGLLRTIVSWQEGEDEAGQKVKNRRDGKLSVLAVFLALVSTSHWSCLGRTLQVGVLHGYDTERVTPKRRRLFCICCVSWGGVRLFGYLESGRAASNETAANSKLGCKGVHGG